MPTSSSPASVRYSLRIEALEDRITPVTVRFDYSLDTSGFFASADRRAALDRVATMITAGMTDSLQAVTPSSNNTWTAVAYNAANGQTVSLPGLTVGQNELVVYITAGKLNGALGVASGGAYSARGAQTWLDTVQYRGQAGAKSGTDFSPWGGLIAFDSGINWDFTAGNPTASQYDFDSIALHEMLHVFGFGLDNPSYTRLVSGGYFNGAHTVAVYGGSVPMQSGEGSDHFAPGTRYGGQEAVMNPAIAPGVRKQMTALEYAGLRDIGWSNTGATSPPVSPPAAVPVSPPVSPPAITPSPIVPPVLAVPTTVNSDPLVVGSGAGAGAGVTAYTTGGQTVYSGTVFTPNFTGGQRVASGDVNGDGVEDYIVGAGPNGSPSVAVINGRTGATIYSLLPYEAGFQGGVYVAAGDVNRDGKADFAVGAGEGGGPRVKLYDGATGTELADFWGIADSSFRGGVRVSLGDINGDGAADLVASAGEGGGPRLAAYDGRTIRGYTTPTRLFWDFFAFEQNLTNGAYVAVSDLNGDGFGDIIAGAGEGGAPRVTVFSGRSLLQGNYSDWVANFFAGDAGTVSGVRVAAADLNGDGVDDLISAPGPNTDGVVRAYSSSEFTKLAGQPVPFNTMWRSDWAAYGAFVG